MTIIWILLFIPLIPAQANLYPQQTNDWISFEFQKCGPSVLILYDNEEGENQDFMVEVEIDLGKSNLSGTQLGLTSVRRIGAKEFFMDYYDIENQGNSTTTLSSVQFWLGLDILNRTINHRIWAAGRYRINNGAWQSFNLQHCISELILFTDREYNYNLTVDINITELTGDLSLFVWHYDTGGHYDIPSEGKYSFNVTGNMVSLTLDGIDNGNATGWYKVTTFERSPIPKVIGFETIIVGSVLALISIIKRKTRNWRF